MFRKSLLAAPLVALAGFAPSAHAASSVVNVQSLGLGAVVQANPDGHVVSAALKPGNFRQHFEMEDSSFGGKLLRLQGTNSCLAAPVSPPPSGDTPVVLASCSAQGAGRVRWNLRDVIPDDGGSQLVNVRTGQAMVPEMFGNANPVLAATFVADAFGIYGEWRFPSAA
jgi:hypothetical protein